MSVIDELLINGKITMTVNFKPHFLTAFMMLPASTAFANGLEDLMQALSSLQGSKPITATLTSEVEVNRGDGDDKVIRTGNVDVVLHDGANGLQVTYSNDVMANIDIEANERVKDEDANTPTLNAVDRLDATEMRSYLSASSSLLRRVEQATFLDEEVVDYQGKHYRMLSFELPMKSIISDKKTREYVDRFESQFQVIIDDQGIPLETRLDFNGKGRAYIVLSMKAFGNGLSQFTVVDNRLVTVRQEFTSGWDSTFGEGSFKEVINLTL